MTESRYAIGIDLGTSNCALSYVDRLAPIPAIQSLPISQCDENFGQVERLVLPSFLYFLEQPEADRVPDQLHCTAGTLPQVAGFLARERQFEKPDRVIHAAKSWLVHGGVDKTDAFLPWRSDTIPPGEKLSPVQVSAAYLRYLKKQWDETFAGVSREYAFDAQQITITVPASFDEAAQQLTLQAASAAGYPAGVRLLEEPTAAFYYWLSQQQNSNIFNELFSEKNNAVLSVLVCDVGGGTTDFSLFEIRKPAGNSILPDIKRVRVSNHILLGGDNIDLALAALALEKAVGAGTQFTTTQWHYLVAQSRKAKEYALQASEGDKLFRLSVPGSGSNLFTATTTIEISVHELIDRVMNGFFPVYDAEAPDPLDSGGIEDFGLPYARDTRVTAHLANFLAGSSVDAVLYTGGTLHPAFIRDRITEVLTHWQGAAPVALVNDEPDLAVAHGAGWSGYVLEHTEGRIRGGYPRTVYLQVAAQKEKDPDVLVCVLPKGSEPGAEIALSDREFRLVLDAPARFQLHIAVDRAADMVGDIFSLTAIRTLRLPSIETVLTRKPGLKLLPGGLIDVVLQARLRETGMLELFLEHVTEAGEKHYWELVFDVRNKKLSTPDASALQSTQSAVPRRQIQTAADQIRSVYGKGRPTGKVYKPGELVAVLEKTLHSKKSEWDSSLLRELWTPLAEGVTRRGRSVQHERVWLNLAGFVLRPGFGIDGDTVRMIQLWRAHSLGLSFPKEKSAQVQWWILWRRVAGGLDRIQQREIYNSVCSLITKKNEFPEVIRLVAALERIPLEDKERFGNYLVDAIRKEYSKDSAHYCWALGRVASRIPLHAPVHTVLPPAVVTGWFKRLQNLDWSGGGREHLISTFSQAGRLIADSELCLSENIRTAIRKKLASTGAPIQFIRPLDEIIERDEQEAAAQFGEKLPAGVRLVSQIDPGQSAEASASASSN